MTVSEAKYWWKIAQELAAEEEKARKDLEKKNAPKGRGRRK